MQQEIYTASTFNNSYIIIDSREIFQALTKFVNCIKKRVMINHYTLDFHVTYFNTYSSYGSDGQIRTLALYFNLNLLLKPSYLTLTLTVNLTLTLTLTLTITPVCDRIAIICPEPERDRHFPKPAGFGRILNRI